MLIYGGQRRSLVVYGGLGCSPLLVPSPGRKCRFYWPAQAKPHTRGVVPSPVRTSRRRGPARATSTSTDRRESARNPTHLEYLDELERSAALPSQSAQRQGHGPSRRACSPLLVPSPGRKCGFYWPAQAKPHTRGMVPNPVRTSRRRDRGPPCPRVPPRLRQTGVNLRTAMCI